MSDTEEDSFPLAAVLFDSQLTRQYSKPHQHAPETWRTAFAAQAGAKTLLSLFRVSRGARDVVLQSAPRLTLRLDLTSTVDIDEGVRQLDSLVQRLSTRGDLLVALRVKWDDSPVASALLTLLPPALQGVSAGVTELTVVYTDEAQGQNRADQRVAEFFLRRAVAVLPNLRSLSLQHWFCTLPPPHSLPQLTQLSITGEHRLQGEPTTAAHRSVALLLPQLSSLTYEEERSLAARLQQARRNALVFTPATTTHTLTRLVTTDSLTDALLGLLLEHAPALRELSVHDMAMVQDHSVCTWGVQWLENRRAISLPSCTLLPTSSHAVVDIVSPLPNFTLTTSMSQADKARLANVRQRVHEWKFTTLKWVSTGGPLGLQDVPNILRHIRGLQAPIWDTVAMASSTCTLEAALALAAELPAWSHMCTVLYLAADLTDELLGVLTPINSYIKVLWVCALSLQHAVATWPCQELCIDQSLDMGMLARLLSTAPCSTVPLIRCINITVGKLVQAEAATLTTWLANVLFAHKLPDATEEYKPEITFHVSCTDATPDQLNLQLSVLRAVKFKLTDLDIQVRIKLEGCAMTSESIGMLCGLPSWRGRIEFSGCQWPAGEQAAAVCTQLAQHVPVSYTRWVLPGAHRNVLEHICVAINQRREGLGMAPVTVCAHLPTQPDALAALAGKHVVLEDLPNQRTPMGYVR